MKKLEINYKKVAFPVILDRVLTMFKLCLNYVHFGCSYITRTNRILPNLQGVSRRRIDIDLAVPTV